MSFQCEHSANLRMHLFSGIRTALLDSEEHICFTCKQSDVSPDNLIANKFLRQVTHSNAYTLMFCIVWLILHDLRQQFTGGSFLFFLSDFVIFCHAGCEQL